MRRFTAPPKKPVKKAPKTKRACTDSTQRRHPPRSTAPFGRPAK